MKYFLASLITVWLISAGTIVKAENLSDIMDNHSKLIMKSSRKTIRPVIDKIVGSELPSVEFMLTQWRSKAIWQNKETKHFVFVKDNRILNIDTQIDLGPFDKKGYKQVKPNSGVRNLISGALVAFQLNSPELETRKSALLSIQRNDDPAYLALLEASLDLEKNQGLFLEKKQVLQILRLKYSKNKKERLLAISSISGSLDVAVRAALNPLVTTKRRYSDSIPQNANILKILVPTKDGFTNSQAFNLLVDGGDADAQPTTDDIKKALAANIKDDQVGGFPISQLTDPQKRKAAYTVLAKAGLVKPELSVEDIAYHVSKFVYFDEYLEVDPQITKAAQQALKNITYKVGLFETIDLILDAVSLASIYFLAAIGLAITFGVMGVINMAHGEFIMLGAYTGYILQRMIPDETVSILLAVPSAFIITFLAGISMERLVIRWLYNRPLETLLATFGISIALQQLAKNIFGTQARPLTSPEWLGGAWIINDVVSISYIRIAIFALALIFLAVFLFIMNRTRLGLETRAVTQNSKMAASMGINPDRVNMLTFGIGSGIAGIAGVAIGLFAKVTSEMGNDYIVQSFMTVVVGGVGNIWGSLAGAAMVGFLQKGIEWLNPSNTLAAQTYMILFIIVFIQFRPRGIIALRGRAAGD